LVDGETGASARSRRTTAHPGLVPVIDVVRLRDGSGGPIPGVDPRGEAFIVLEPADGESLEDLVRRKGALDSVRAVRLALAVANGLTSLHIAGTVHGGVMPMAFEVRALEEGGPRLGLAGLHDGAIAYSSPSRLCDGGPSTHDDAWGLLACLYFAVSGGPPFAAESQQALARRVLGGRPVPIRADTPALVDLQKMFDRGFSRTASQRYVDVAGLRDDLKQWLAAHGASSDEPLATMRPPDALQAPAMAITARKADAYPRVFPDTTSSRNRTAPWGGAEDVAPGTHTHPTPAETPSARQPETVPDVAVASQLRTEPPARPRTVPPIPRTDPPGGTSSFPPGNEETARFSREQLLLLEKEADRASAPLDPRMLALARSMTADESDDAPPGSPQAPRPAAGAPPAPPRPTPRPEVIERTLPLTKPAEPVRRSNVPLALGLGGVLAAAGVALLVVSMRTTTPAPRAPDVPTASTSAPVAVPAPSAHVPAPKLVSTAAPSASVTRSPQADDLLTCAARSFPPDTFDPDADLEFLCNDRDGRKAAQRLRRAIVAGGRGARISEAMREWSRYRWYELPVLTTVRARCCPGAAPVEVPTVCAACASRRSSVYAVASAAAGDGGELDGALREYRRFVACLMESGDFPAFGQDAPIGAGEEAAFRALVARGKK
jgi:serine/threonine protein kinase